MKRLTTLSLCTMSALLGAIGSCLGTCQEKAPETSRSYVEEIIMLLDEDPEGWSRHGPFWKYQGIAMFKIDTELSKTWRLPYSGKPFGFWDDNAISEALERRTIGLADKQLQIKRAHEASIRCKERGGVVREQSCCVKFGDAYQMCSRSF